MSRSSFLTTKETDLRYHHGLVTTNRSNENSTKNTSINRHNPKTKRNLRDKRRATGIRPNDVPLTTTSTEGSANDDNDDDEDNIKEEDEHEDRTVTKPVFTVNRIQTNFDNLSITRSSNHCPISRFEQCDLIPTMSTKHHRNDKQTSDDDLNILKERIQTLETILHEKDNYIHDLQLKLTNLTQNLTEAEEQIFKLHQDKLTLIKAFSTVQDTKTPSIRSTHHHSRN